MSSTCLLKWHLTAAVPRIMCCPVMACDAGQSATLLSVHGLQQILRTGKHELHAARRWQYVLDIAMVVFGSVGAVVGTTASVIKLVHH